MGDLDHDTAVVGADGTWTADLSEDWAIWGPNGGYLAAVALRAAGAHTALTRPASMVCHYLGVARFAPVELTTETLRGSRRAESIKVTMTQEGQPILSGMVWAVADDLDGLDHDLSGAAPQVAGPDELADIVELRGEASDDDRPRPRFFDNFDVKPLEWIPDDQWAEREAGEPRHRGWYRLRPRATFDDPWVEAGRLAVLVDTFMWPAAARGYAEGELRHIAPSLDLQVSFHRMTTEHEWLLVDAVAPTAGEGLVGGRADVWTPDGLLAASGSQQMFCRPVPG